MAKRPERKQASCWRYLGPAPPMLPVQGRCPGQSVLIYKFWQHADRVLGHNRTYTLSFQAMENTGLAPPCVW